MRGSPVVVASPASEVAGTPLDSLPSFCSFGKLHRSLSTASASADPAAASASPATSVRRQFELQTPAGRWTGAAERSSPARTGSAGGIRQRSAAGAAGARRLSGAAAGRRLSAPSGYTESIASDAATPSFSVQAPSGWTDDEEEGEVVQSRRRRSSIGAGVRPLSPAELALAQLTAQLEEQLRLATHKKVGELERELADIDAAEAEEVAAVARKQQQAVQALVAAEAAAQQRRQAERQQLLSGLRSEHQQKAAESQRRVEQLEHAARQKQEEERKAREAAAAAAAAERKAKEAAAAAAEAEKAKQQKAAEEQAAAEGQRQAKAAEQKAAQEAAAKATAAQQRSGVRIAPSAAAWEKQCAEALAAAQESVKPFVEDRGMRDKKRSIDKFVTLNVQQISATLEQVRLKGQALAQFLGQQHGIQKTYALLTLANKLLSQCEVQITRLHSFAFPLAEVTVVVMAAHHEFVEILLGRLHQICCLAVPKYYVYRSGEDEDAYLKQLGYKITVDEDTGKVSKESTDDYLARMMGYVLFYAAICQSDHPQNPHGLQHAWTYLARLLNALPATRVTATALDGMLRVAAFRMCAAYRAQFMKLLAYIDQQYLPALSTSNDPDARAVYTRIQTFLKTGRFRQPPEGRDMPATDASSYDRA